MLIEFSLVFFSHFDALLDLIDFLINFLWNIYAILMYEFFLILLVFVLGIQSNYLLFNGLSFLSGAENIYYFFILIFKLRVCFIFLLNCFNLVFYLMNCFLIILINKFLFQISILIIEQVCSLTDHVKMLLELFYVCFHKTNIN